MTLTTMVANKNMTLRIAINVPIIIVIVPTNRVSATRSTMLNIVPMMVVPMPKRNNCRI